MSTSPRFRADTSGKDPSAIFVADRIGHRKNVDLLSDLATAPSRIPLIVRFAMLEKEPGGPVLTWDQFIRKPSDDADYYGQLDRYWARANPDDTLCVQFTSGTTGPRKAAMLSHRYAPCHITH